MYPHLRRSLCIDIYQTLTSRLSEKLQFARANSDTSEGEGDDSQDLDIIPDELVDEPPPLRAVLTKPVIISLANFAMLTLLNGVLESYFPLVWSTPAEYGGLSLSPASIGMWLSLYGGMNGIFQFLFFPHFISRFGPRRVFVFSIVSSAVILAIFPFENLAVVAGGGPNLVVWLLIIAQMSSLCVFDMGYGEYLGHIP